MEVARRLRDRALAVPPLVADGALALLLAVAAEVEFSVFNPGAGSPGQPPAWLMVLLLTLPLAVRRRYPIPCAAVQLAGSALIRAQPPYFAIFALVIGLYSLTVYGPAPWLGLVWAAWSFVALLVFLPGIRMQVAPAVMMLLVGALGWLGGITMRRLRADRELVARMAVEDERRRIARELHDVVAHSVSLMVVQAGAARMVRGQPERAVTVLQQVEASGRQALDDLRHLLGLLASERDAAELAPQPGVGQLRQLIETFSAAGLGVELEVSGDRRQLPPGLDVTVYRIVQEALTNALKHAPGACAEVRLNFGPDELEVAITDSGGKGQPVVAPGGHGLTGMRERVAVYGGRLEAGWRPEGGFAVRAWLPTKAA